jgi:N4-gp56 family major capsid protein
MAIDNAVTLSTNTNALGTAIKSRYYDELFLRVAEKNLIFQQLGQLNRQIPKGENAAVVYWTRWVNLALITTSAKEGAPTTAVPLSAVNVTGTSSQYDNAISLSDLAVAYSFGDVMKAAMTRLAYNAGLSIDTITRNIVVPGATVQVATGLGQYATTAIPATGVLSIAELRKGIRTLKKNNAFQVGGALNANEEGSSGYWICTISPDQEYDLQGDSTTGAWIDANRYAGSEAIFEGEIGKLYGTRFLETSNGYSYTNSAIASTGDVHVSLLTGSDYFGVTTMQNLQTFVKDFGSGGIADPTNKVATAGWKATFGATVLNSTFAVGIQTAVTA